MTKHYQAILIFLGLLLLGVFFRTYQPGWNPFGFDQVQILENAQQIKQGDFTLIGPRTGPGNMFTGPLIYYLTACLMFILPSPWTIVGTSVLIAAASGVAL